LRLAEHYENSAKKGKNTKKALPNRKTNDENALQKSKTWHAVKHPLKGMPARRA